MIPRTYMVLVPAISCINEPHMHIYTNIINKVVTPVKENRDVPCLTEVS